MKRTNQPFKNRTLHLLCLTGGLVVCGLSAVLLVSCSSGGSSASAARSMSGYNADYAAETAAVSADSAEFAASYDAASSNAGAGSASGAGTSSIPLDYPIESSAAAKASGADSSVQPESSQVDGTNTANTGENSENTAGESDKTTSNENSGNAAETTAPRKLIRNVDLSFETTSFTEFTDALQQQTKQLSGYIETSDVSGDRNDGMRYASFTLRIPQEKLDAFLNTVEGKANLLRKYETTQDITLTYYDTESRKKVLYTEQERLLELLAQAQSMDAIIALEQRLSEIRYELESYESDLRRYDNSVQYSTVTVSVTETAVLTAAGGSSVPARMSAGFARNLEHVRDFLINLSIGLVTIIPSLIALGVFAMLIYGIYRCVRHRKNRTEKGNKDSGNKHSESGYSENESRSGGAAQIPVSVSGPENAAATDHTDHPHSGKIAQETEHAAQTENGQSSRTHDAH